MFMSPFLPDGLGDNLQEGIVNGANGINCSGFEAMLLMPDCGIDKEGMEIVKLQGQEGKCVKSG
jgi:hypothetical protein